MQIHRKGALNINYIKDNIENFDEGNIVENVGEIQNNEIEIEHNNGYIYKVNSNLEIMEEVKKATMQISILPNGIEGVEQVEVTIEVVALQGKIDESSLKYAWSEDRSEPEETEFVPFTNGEKIPAKDLAQSLLRNFLWVKAKDTEGNERIQCSKGYYYSAMGITINLEPEGATNQDVIVTINYEGALDLLEKEYSLDGENWNPYKEPFPVMQNRSYIWKVGI